MPKKKFNAQEFIDDLLKDSDLSVEQKSQLTSTITSNEKLTSKLGESVMRQSDYSREIADLQKQNDDVQKFRTELVDWKQQNEQVVLNAQAEAEAYRRRLAEAGIVKPPPETAGADVFTRKDFEKYSADLQNQGLNVMAKLAKIAVGHLHKYKEELDTDVLLKQAIEQNLPLDVTYERMKAPLDTKLQQADFDRKLIEAKEEGRREAMTTAGFPSDRPWDVDTIHPLDLAANAKDSNGQIKVGWKAAAEAHVADYKSGKIN